jgi:hypothetical protein
MARHEKYTRNMRGLTSQHRTGTISWWTLMYMLREGLSTYGHVWSAVMITQIYNTEPSSYYLDGI